jgi:phosphoribosylformylglycinamidine synthase
MSNPVHFFSLRGSSALSPFRLDKLYATLKKTAPSIQHVYAEFVHFVFSENDLVAAQKNTLTQILTYGPKTQTESPSGELFLVIPRIGTISPWASRATDIANNCGLVDVLRIERGVAYYVTTANGQPLSGMRKRLLEQPSMTA